MPSITLKGVSIKGQSKVAYTEAVTKAQSEAQSALSQEQVPRAYQGAVKDYFDDLKELRLHVEGCRVQVESWPPSLQVKRVRRANTKGLRLSRRPSNLKIFTFGKVIGKFAETRRESSFDELCSKRRQVYII